VTLGLGFSLCLDQRLEMRMAFSLPSIQWSLVRAFRDGAFDPPMPPTERSKIFEPFLRLERRQLQNFMQYDHTTRMQRVEDANTVFRFAYSVGRKGERGKKRYFKIPLQRDWNQDTESLAIAISLEEYMRCSAMLRSVSEAERIVRAIPYATLLTTTLSHIAPFDADRRDTVVVAVDRGGRIPGYILALALGIPEGPSLKVDQGSDGLDQERLAQFARERTFAGKHILFVDSTVDSGRQHQALSRVFDTQDARDRLNYRSWSLIGSNEYGEEVAPNHCNVNWGVDPDETFEDDPELMGVDYAPGSDRTKTVECPTDISRAIRALIATVPQGLVWEPIKPIDAQIASQRSLWNESAPPKRKQKRKRSQRASIDIDVMTRVQRITRTRKWHQMHDVLPKHVATNPPLHRVRIYEPPGARHSASVKKMRVLLIGHSRQTISHADTESLVRHLAPHVILATGTTDGNPGAVLHEALRHPDVDRLSLECYHTKDDQKDKPSLSIITHIAAGQTVADKRWNMIKEADAILALGGSAGTLNEALIAILTDKPLFLIKGFGAIAATIHAQRSLRDRSNLHTYASIPEATDAILRLLFV
jgi:hypoxanthine phosphoribosyltransferase